MSLHTASPTHRGHCTLAGAPVWARAGPLADNHPSGRHRRSSYDYGQKRPGRWGGGLPQLQCVITSVGAHTRAGVGARKRGQATRAFELPVVCVVRCAFLMTVRENTFCEQNKRDIVFSTHSTCVSALKMAVALRSRAGVRRLKD